MKTIGKRVTKERAFFINEVVSTLDALLDNSGYESTPNTCDCLEFTECYEGEEPANECDHTRARTAIDELERSFK